MTWSAYACWKYVIIKPLRRVAFPMSGRKQCCPCPLFTKKDDKQLLKSYRPISLLPICGRALERLLYNSMFEFFIQNNLISPNQSGFRRADSCINQLISITGEICKSFDDGYKVRVYLLIYRKHLTKHGSKVFTTN